MIQELHDNAKIISENKIALDERLRNAKSVLYSCYKAYFIRGKLDFYNKRLIGTNGFYLQWENDGKSSIGSVYLCKQ